MAPIAKNIGFPLSLPFHVADVAAVGVGKSVAITDVGFDVEDGGAIEQVNTLDVQNGAIHF